MPEIGIVEGSAIVAIALIFAKTLYEVVVSKVGKSDCPTGDVENQIEKLLELHEPKDTDGVPIWYFKESLRGTLEQTSHNTFEIKTALSEFLHSQKNLMENMEEAVRNLSDQIRFLNNLLEEEQT